MGRFMWENMNMKPVKIEDITPELLVELEKRAASVRIEQLTLARLNELSEQRQVAIATLNDLELECQMRCMRAHSLGISKAELARIFNVTPNTIKKWIG